MRAAHHHRYKIADRKSDRGAHLRGKLLEDAVLADAVLSAQFPPKLRPDLVAALANLRWRRRLTRSEKTLSEARPGLCQSRSATLGPTCRSRSQRLSAREGAFPSGRSTHMACSAEHIHSSLACRVMISRGIARRPSQSPLCNSARLRPPPGLGLHFTGR